MALRLAPLFSSSFTICRNKPIGLSRNPSSDLITSANPTDERRRLSSHLLEPALSSVVQGGSAGAVRHVQVAQVGEQGLGAARGTVGSGHVQRRLPELVSCVGLCPAPQQQPHGPLEQRKQTGVQTQQ